MKRVQKILAEAGVASRRKCEVLIAEGRVKVNGKTISLGTTADESDTIAVDGKKITVEKKVYILLNKPKGYVCTVAESHGMQTVMDLVDVPERVFPVGRLDKNTEGVLLFTNDGDLAQRLLHPSFNVEKEYVAELDEPFRAKTKLMQGVMVDGRKVDVKNVQVKENKVKLRIHEGRKHIVRKVFAVLGYKVVSLTRTEFAGIRAGSLPVGKWRFLSQKEVYKQKGSFSQRSGSAQA